MSDRKIKTCKSSEAQAQRVSEIRSETEHLRDVMLDLRRVAGAATGAIALFRARRVEQLEQKRSRILATAQMLERRAEGTPEWCEEADQLIEVAKATTTQALAVVQLQKGRD